MPISDQDVSRCRQYPQKYRHHHCTLVLPDAGLDVPASGLACPLNSCVVNLVASAYNEDAVPGDFLLVGEDQPNDGTASIQKDKGRITRRIAPSSRETR
jgi:hypothetical protein